MPRPIWKGHISFGLVNIPVVLEGAESPKELQFNLLDSRNRARVRYERVNDATGEPVPWNEIVKGYEYEEGQYVLLSDEDFKRAAVEASQTIAIEDFVDRDAIDVRYCDKPYYVLPGNRGEKGYVLLHEALTKTGKAGIARVVIRTRQYLAALLPVGPALVLNLLRFHDELRPLDELKLPSSDLAEHKIAPRELEMAGRLVKSMSTRWKPEKYHDEYRAALMKWIEQKARTAPLAQTPAVDTPEPEPAVVNIMDLLQRSLEQKERPRKKAAAGERRAAPKRKRA
jgi:DNA end-binding protein Ku